MTPAPTATLAPTRERDGSAAALAVVAVMLVCCACLCFAIRGLTDGRFCRDRCARRVVTATVVEFAALPGPRESAQIATAVAIPIDANDEEGNDENAALPVARVASPERSRV